MKNEKNECCLCKNNVKSKLAYLIGSPFYPGVVLEVLTDNPPTDDQLKKVEEIRSKFCFISQ